MFKFLAAFLMLIDHICHIFAPYLSEEVYLLGRTLGRLAFPMFAYALARGYNRTSNIFRYFLRLSVFAVITQVLFAVVTNRLGLERYFFMNVLITFALAIGLLVGGDLIEKSSLDMMLMMKPVLSEGTEQKSFSPGGIRLPARTGTILGIILVGLVIFLTVRLEPDYSLVGLLTVLLFQRIDRYLPDYEVTLRADLKRKRWLLYFFTYAALCLLIVLGNVSSYGSDYYTWMSMFAVLGVLFFPLYERQQKPGPAAKYFFYLFYPLHFILLLALFSLKR